MDRFENEPTIIPTTVEHIRLLVANMRDDDLQEARDDGVTPFKGVWRSYRSSEFCHSCFIGDRIMAIGGINGSVLGFVGRPWLITSKVADEYPLVFAMLYRRETHKMLKQYRVLERYVGIRYVKTIKLMKIIGFKERETVPAKSGMFVRLEMEASA